MLNRSLIIFVSKLTEYGFRLILPYFLVRLMTIADFGAYRQFFLLEAYIAVLFQFGVSQSLYYFIPRDERNAGAYLINSLALNCLVFAVAFTGIGLVRQPLSAWLNMAILDNAFWHLAIYTMILMLTASCNCYLIAVQKIKASAVLTILGQLVTSLVAVAAAFYWKDLPRIILAIIAARALVLFIMLAFIQFRLRGFRAESYLKDIWIQVRYGVVLGFAGTAVALQTKLHHIFISRYYGLEPYAIYSVGCTEIPLMSLFSQSVALVALGKFALLEKEGDWDGIRQLWTRILTSMYAVAIPVIILLLAVSEPLIRFMFTDTYIEALPIFRINTLIKLNLIFNATLVLRAMNRNDMTIKVNLGVLLATPFALYGGMMAAGTAGVIAAQCLLLISGRVILLACLNRISGADLDYLVGPRALLAFYAESWRSLDARARKLYRQKIARDSGSRAGS